MATIPTSEIIAELAKHPYKQTDKVQIGGSDHYVKVFVLGTQTPKIIEDSGNPSSIAQACDDILCVGKKGIVVDGTTCYVLKETTPCGTFKRAVVFESSTNAQIVGVVDNDSVQLSTQQGGGIKVASTLPNGGDFVGQICVLTTGSTYVWTGSQWSSTAGSSTLPTATSANLGHGLISTGSAWTTRVNNACRLLWAERGYTIVSGKWVGFELCTVNDSSLVHIGFDVQCGSHAAVSRKVHVDITSTALATNCKVAIVEFPSIRVDQTFVHAPANVKIYWDKSTKKIYVAVKADGTYGIAGSVFDFVTGDAVTLNTNYQIPPFSVDMESESSLTEATNIQYCTTPVSTAANQMLVSDGNGGWKVGAVQALQPSASAHTPGSYLYKKIATHSAISGHKRGQLTFRYTVGVHNTFSFSGDVKLTVDLDTATTTGRLNYTMSEVPAYIATSSSSTVYLSTVLDLFLFRVGYDLYVGINPLQTYNQQIMITLDSFINDEDWTFHNGTTTWDGIDTTLPEGYALADGIAHFWIPPSCTTADNGKVLKVVSGVPTWVSPTE